MKRVKVALDVNIPHRIVRMLQAGFTDQGFEFIHEPQFAAHNAEDQHWAVAFRRFGGEIVISADKNIAKKPHQIIAFKDSDLICFFCQRTWAQQDHTFKAAHLIYWWPRIQKHLVKCKPKDCWWIPMGLGPLDINEVRVPDDVLKAATNGKPA